MNRGSKSKVKQESTQDKAPIFTNVQKIFSDSSDKSIDSIDKSIDSIGNRRCTISTKKKKETRSLEVKQKLLKITRMVLMDQIEDLIQ